MQDVEDVIVLICGHGGRDMRCGVLGPVLRDEFADKLDKEGFNVASGAVPASIQDTNSIEGDSKPGKTVARIGLISHIGGHKFAGNVIIYLPPSLKLGSEKHPLAGHGIWYGRVEPKHVEGIVKESVLKGNIIADMFRGGIDPDRRILRL